MEAKQGNIKLIAFDLDDTLYPEISFVQSGFRAVAQAIEKQYPGVNSFYNLLWGVFSDGERTKTFDRALAKAGITATVEEIREMVDVYRSHLPAITIYPDAREILECLWGRIITGLITDGYLETQRNKVKALHIEAYFNMIIYTDKEGRDSWKPSPWGYQQMMTQFNLQGDQCAYVGDNSLKDFAGAKALGWRTIKVVRSDGLYKNVNAVPENEADCSICTLADLKKLI